MGLNRATIGRAMCWSITTFAEISGTATPVLGASCKMPDAAAVNGLAKSAATLCPSRVAPTLSFAGRGAGNARRDGGESWKVTVALPLEINGTVRATD